MTHKYKYSDIVNSISGELNLSHKAADEIIKEYINILKDQALKDKSLRMHDIGSFNLKWHNDRQVYNPKSGQKINKAAHYSLKFKAASKIKDMVNKEFKDLPYKIIKEPPVKSVPTAAKLPLITKTEKKIEIPQQPVEKKITQIQDIPKPVIKNHLYKESKPPSSFTTTEKNKLDESRRRMFNWIFISLAFLSVFIITYVITVLALTSEYPDPFQAVKKNTIAEEIIFDNYALQDDDTLYTIAYRYYDDEHKWPYIYFANLEKFAGLPDKFNNDFRTIKIALNPQKNVGHLYYQLFYLYDKNHQPEKAKEMIRGIYRYNKELLVSKLPEFSYSYQVFAKTLLN